MSRSPSPPPPAPLPPPAGSPQALAGLQQALHGLHGLHSLQQHQQLAALAQLQPSVEALQRLLHAAAATAQPLHHTGKLDTALASFASVNILILKGNVKE